jgi:hypothetical protein
MFTRRSPTFSFATLDDEWISLSPKTAFEPIVIVDLTPTNMVQRTSTMTSHVAMMVAQEKTQLMSEQ